jgi:hypothetical protein
MSVSRRAMLGTILGSAGLATLDGCLPYTRHFIDSGSHYQFEKHFEEGSLKYNPSRRLKKYRGKKGDPLTRESELVHLARTEDLEEAFLHISPKNIWYETGLWSKRNACFGTSKRFLEYSGEGIVPKIQEAAFYHYHPFYLIAKLVLEQSFKKGNNKRTSFDLAYQHALDYAPPSGTDIKLIKMLDKAKSDNIKLIPKVADHSGVWSFNLSPKFLKHCHKHGDKKLDEIILLMRHAEVLEFMNTAGTPKGYISRFIKYMKSTGFKGDELQLSYRPIGKRFHISMKELKKELKRRPPLK